MNTDDTTSTAVSVWSGERFVWSSVKPGCSFWTEHRQEEDRCPGCGGHLSAQTADDFYRQARRHDFFHEGYFQKLMSWRDRCRIAGRVFSGATLNGPATKSAMMTRRERRAEAARERREKRRRRRRA